jgi:hypothetical protein
MARSVRFEYPLDDGGKADYALFDRQGRALDLRARTRRPAEGRAIAQAD